MLPWWYWTSGCSFVDNRPGGQAGCMDDFSQVVLESTLDLVTEVMPPASYPHVSECVNAARCCMTSTPNDRSNSDQDAILLEYVNQLFEIARQNGLFLIAGRLRTIARCLTE